MLSKLNNAQGLVHFYLIVGTLFFQALTFGDAYRFFAYANLVFVAMLVINAYAHSTFTVSKPLLFSLIALITLVGLDWLATAHYSVDIKAYRHLLLSVGLMLGIVLLVKHNKAIAAKLMPTLFFSIYSYMALQLVAIYVFERPYGTTKNPHYLAIYCTAFMVLAAFVAIKASRLLHQCLLLFSIFALGSILIYTSSRPTWIALVAACMIAAVCLHQRARLLFLLAMTVVLLSLSLSNVGNFKGRLDDLVMHAHTEERVTIWQDTWTMQQSSTVRQWVVGHGAEGFEQDFPTYSRYHKQHIDFNSPHNAVLEILYQHGVIGLILIMGFFIWLYQALFTRYFVRQKHSGTQWIYLLMTMILTIDLFAVGITLPFFNSINLNIIAVIIGLVLYLDKVNSQS